MEKDEAGRLRAFREKFGRGWDVDKASVGEEDDVVEAEESEDNLMDLISGFGQTEGDAKGVREKKQGSSKGKGGE